MAENNVEDWKLTGEMLIDTYGQFLRSRSGKKEKHWDRMMSEIDYKKVLREEVSIFVRFLEKRIESKDDVEALPLLARIGTRDAADTLARIVSGWSDDQFWMKIDRDHAPKIIEVLAKRNAELLTDVSRVKNQQPFLEKLSEVITKLQNGGYRSKSGKIDNVRLSSDLELIGYDLTLAKLDNVDLQGVDCGMLSHIRLYNASLEGVKITKDQVIPLAAAAGLLKLSEMEWGLLLVNPYQMLKKRGIEIAKEIDGDITYKTLPTPERRKHISDNENKPRAAFRLDGKKRKVPVR